MHAWCARSSRNWDSEHDLCDRSRDFGILHLNMWWAQSLARETALTGATVRIYLGARGDLLRAIGFHHSHQPPLADGYCQRMVAAATGQFDRSASR